MIQHRQALTVDTGSGCQGLCSVEVWRWRTCRTVQRRGERQNKVRKTEHTDNPSKKKRRRGGEGAEMVVDVEAVGKLVMLKTEE